MSDKYELEDLVSTTFDQKPIDFADAFETLLGDRIASAIADRKIEVARSLFGTPNVETTEES